MSDCERCGAFLYFSQRLAGNRWCQLCAAELGVFMVGDPALASLRKQAAAIPPWWRWTLWLRRALQLVEAREQKLRGEDWASLMKRHREQKDTT